MGQGFAPLPDQNDVFWHGEKGETCNIRPVQRCDVHNFKQVSGTAVECSVCHAGFYLSPGMCIEDGHIYYEGELVI